MHSNLRSESAVLTHTQLTQGTVYCIVLRTKCERKTQQLKPNGRNDARGWRTASRGVTFSERFDERHCSETLLTDDDDDDAPSPPPQVRITAAPALAWSAALTLTLDAGKLRQLRLQLECRRCVLRFDRRRLRRLNAPKTPHISGCKALCVFEVSKRNVGSSHKNALALDAHFCAISH